MIDLIIQYEPLITFTLIGLIWTIQLVHYPAFKYIDKEKFIAFEKMHTSKISLLVAPLMVLELMIACIHLYEKPAQPYAMISLFLVLLIWISTFTLSVPCHSMLKNGKDEKIIHKLILTNWVRTILWTFKGILIFNAPFNR